MRLEQRTDEEALHSSEMKKQELMNKKQQLSEQRCVCVCADSVDYVLDTYILLMCAAPI